MILLYCYGKKVYLITAIHKGDIEYKGMKKNEIPVNTSSNPPVRKKSELQSRKDLLLQEYRLKMLHNSSDDHINSNDPIITSDKCSVLAIAEKILAEKT